MMPIMDGVALPPDLEQFAAEAVAAGRFRDIGEVVAAGVGLLQRAEALRGALRTSVLSAEARGERDGFLSIEEVMQDADRVLDEIADRQR